MSSSLTHLLAQTETILEHQKQAEILRGESFNIFSVLSMESKENKTHSAFLRELLDPNGSHLQGDRFLKLFLNEVGYTGVLDYQTTSVKVEHHVGAVDLSNKTGGRIDIYIWDESNHTISIENKIWAGDQEAQVERYVNHNKDKNTVYYLALHRTEPSDDSKGSLESGKDYYTLSYKDDIRRWLELCLKESVEVPILRESIKQYIILIKKLTHTMDNKQSEELMQLLMNNYETASVIHDNVLGLERRIGDLLVAEVRSLLEEKIAGLSRGWEIVTDSDLNKAWTGLFLRHNDLPDLSVGLQGQSKIPWNKSVVGVVAGVSAYNRVVLRKIFESYENDTDYVSNDLWAVYKWCLNMETVSARAKMTKEELREAKAEEIASIMFDFTKLIDQDLGTIKNSKI